MPPAMQSLPSRDLSSIPRQGTPMSPGDAASCEGLSPAHLRSPVPRRVMQHRRHSKGCAEPLRWIRGARDTPFNAGSAVPRAKARLPREGRSLSKHGQRGPRQPAVVTAALELVPGHRRPAEIIHDRPARDDTMPLAREQREPRAALHLRLGRHETRSQPANGPLAAEADFTQLDTLSGQNPAPHKARPRSSTHLPAPGSRSAARPCVYGTGDQAVRASGNLRCGAAAGGRMAIRRSTCRATLSRCCARLSGVELSIR